MRARKTSLGFADEALALVEMPVALAPATSQASDIKTEMVAPSGAKASTVYIDPATGEMLTKEQLRRGVKRGDSYAIIPDAAWQAITERTKLTRMTVLETVRPDMVPAERICDVHFVQGADGVVPRALAALAQALLQTNMAAIVKFGVGSRQRLGALVGRGDGALLVKTLTFAADCKEPDEDVLAPAQAEISPTLLENTVELVESLEGDGTSLETAVDDAIADRRKLVELALEGETIPVPDALPTVTDSEQDLEDRLAASVAAVKKSRGKAKTKAKPRAKAGAR